MNDHNQLLDKLFDKANRVKVKNHNLQHLPNEIDIRDEKVLSHFKHVLQLTGEQGGYILDYADVSFQFMHDDTLVDKIIYIGSGIRYEGIWDLEIKLKYPYQFFDFLITLGFTTCKNFIKNHYSDFDYDIFISTEWSKKCPQTILNHFKSDESQFFYDRGYSGNLDDRLDLEITDIDQQKMLLLELFGLIDETPQQIQPFLHEIIFNLISNWDVEYLAFEIDQCSKLTQEGLIKYLSLKDVLKYHFNQYNTLSKEMIKQIIIQHKKNNNLNNYWEDNLKALLNENF